MQPTPITIDIDTESARQAFANMLRDCANEFRDMADNMEASAIKIEADMRNVDSVPAWDDEA